MIGANNGLLKALESKNDLEAWIEAVEPDTCSSMKLRVLLGEAAHFVFDSACALRRDKKEEVLPLFLTGIKKLIDLLERIEGRDRPDLSAETKDAMESPNYGAAVIRNALSEMVLSSNSDWAWDVMEVLVKSESTSMAQQLLSDLCGEYLPKGTVMHVSTQPTETVSFPCVLIH